MFGPVRTERKRCDATVTPRGYGRNIVMKPRPCSNYAQEGEDYCGIHLKTKVPSLKPSSKIQDAEVRRVYEEAATEMAAAINKWKRHFNGKSN